MCNMILEAVGRVTRACGVAAGAVTALMLLTDPASAQVTSQFIGTTQDIGPASYHYGGAVGQMVHYSQSRTVNQLRTYSVTGQANGQVPSGAQLDWSINASVGASNQQTWNQSVTGSIWVPRGRRVALRPAVVYEVYTWQYKLWGVTVAYGTKYKFQGAHVLQAWQ